MEEAINLALSIIVPVYNVEDYIRPCIESIFRQGLDEDSFEVIIVNDGTQDHSMEVIQDIIDQHKNIIVINQENLGLSLARNNGISKAKGQYILMLDSDDLLIDNSLKPLLEKAIESQVDLVVADFIRMTNEEIINLQAIPQKDFCIQKKTGEQLFLEDLNPKECYVWHTLYNKNFLIEANLKFYPNIKYEDIPFTHECYLKAKQCLRIFWNFYIYRQRSNSITHSFNKENAIKYCIAISRTMDLTHSNFLNSAIDHKLREDMWTSFSFMIRLVCKSIKKDKDRIEIIDYIRKEGKNISFHNGKRQIIISFLLQNTPHLFIRLRYFYKIIIEDRVLPFYYHHLKG